MKWIGILFVCLLGKLHAQKELVNELIVYWPDAQLVEWSALEGFEKSRPLSQSLIIDHLIFDTEENCSKAASVLRAQAAVVQTNYSVNFRREPNDNLYGQQPNLDRLNMPRLWEEFQGGQTSNGRDIVIAILDSGFDTNHEDLRDNLWQNPAEIVNDGIDNDNNGYVDDVIGWNFVGNQPIPTSDSHGTSVVGILGAEGDNGIGVSGMNWQSQLMLFQISTVADIVSAYDYIIAQRQLYNSSQGAEGAFIAATNASFGLEGQSCNNFPLWAMQYDRLGDVGILTAASTANREWDVDDFGDMPTTCPSDFLVSVANSDSTGALFRSSAWGLESIDLAAPGQGSFSTRPNNNYGAFGSTSAAAPYVTGTIALLYGHPCERFQEMISSDPKAAALMVREAILGSVTLVPPLAALVASGGELAPWQAWQRMDLICEDRELGEIQIFDIGPNPAFGNSFISFDTEGLGPYFVRLYDNVGRMVYETRVTTRPPARVEIPMNGLAVGVYRLGVFDGDRVSWTSLLKM
ncbi:MAG: S8 family serine peptidase [Bacteroidota bacterium]